MGRKSKPYATMADGPDAYLFRKDGKQKLVGSADNEICSTCDGQGMIQTADGDVRTCVDCDGKSRKYELEEDEGYQYRTYTDYEEDNSKIWHEGKAPGGDWEVIDRSPYAEMDDFAWNLYVDFHKENGRWPNQQESRKIEDLEYKVMTKMNEELNEMRTLAGLPVMEDCDTDEEKNDDGECSPFTHADENVDMVKEDDMEEDFLAPPKDVEHGHYEDDGDDDWDERDAPELDRQTNFDAPSRYDGDDSFDFDIDNDYYMDEQGPGDDEFDADPDAMVDVGDDEDYEDFDFEDEFSAMMGNTTRFESVVEMNELRRLAGLAPIEESEVAEETVNESLPTHGPKEWWKNDPEVLMGYIYWLQRQLPPKDKKEAWAKIVAKLNAENPAPEGAIPTLEGMVEEGEGDTCSRCRKGKMHRGETFMGPAEQCDHCNFQRQLDESAPHATDDVVPFEFNDEKAYYLVADEIGDRISFGQFDEILVPEQYVDGIIMLLDTHGFQQGKDFVISTMDEALQNGYGEHEYADAYDDYFPRGATSTPASDLGPTAGRHGDNPLRTPMSSVDKDDVYESMRQKYRRYRLS